MLYFRLYEIVRRPVKRLVKEKRQTSSTHS